MSRVCTICTHQQRLEIDKALLDGGTVRDVAGRYAVSKSAVERHKNEHLPARIERHENGYIRKLGRAAERALEVVQESLEAEDNPWMRLSAAKEVRGLMALFMDMMRKDLEREESTDATVGMWSEFLMANPAVEEAWLDFLAGRVPERRIRQAV